MKKTAILAGLLFAVMSGVFGQVSVAGQTYYYKYVETVDSETGVRRQDNSIEPGIPASVYITFTSNSCYFSNASGQKESSDPTDYTTLIGDDPSNIAIISLTGNGVYSYRGEENNLYAFVCKKTFKNLQSMTKYSSTLVINGYLLFSKDYRRLNKRSRFEDGKWSSIVFVYERTEPQQQQRQDGPFEFY